MQFLFAAVLICFMPAPPWAQGAKPNLSGEWRLDAANSDFGQTPPPESIIHVIDHKEPHIRIETTTTTSEAGKGSSTQDFTTDGEASVNKMRVMGGEQDVKVTSKWNDRKLSTAWSFAAQGITIEFNDSWSVSEDGKVLTLVRTVKTPQGPFGNDPLQQAVAGAKAPDAEDREPPQNPRSRNPAGARSVYNPAPCPFPDTKSSCGLSSKSSAMARSRT